jgi:hypothetical protein
MIVIFDNLFILATGYDDKYRKFDIFQDSCTEYGLCMKLAKTWIGFRDMKFFVYKFTHNKFELSMIASFAGYTVSDWQEQATMSRSWSWCCFFDHS